MKINEAIKSAREIFGLLPIRLLERKNINVDRVYENPEAARYFLMFSEWGKISKEKIFSDLIEATALRTNVYIDIPFCKKFCTFCAFYGVVPRSSDQVQGYVKSLISEISMIRKSYFNRGFKVTALELGGGTPTYLNLVLLKDLVRHLLNTLPFEGEFEFNCETSPETITGREGIKKLEFLKSSGVNRISIGVQAFQDHLLKSTNRPHNLKDILESIKNIKEIGYARVNVDLLLGLYAQTMKEFLDSVTKAVDFNFDIIELYTLRYFDTKEFIPMKTKLKDKSGFLTKNEILIARIAADIILRAAGYISNNGRTYTRVGAPQAFYAEYYRGNFSGMNTLGLGRKSNSNIYPWQYANYRNLDKYQKCLAGNKLPIACGTRFSDKARFAKLLTGAFQLTALIDYQSLRSGIDAEWIKDFDNIIYKFLKLGLIKSVDGGYEKTVFGFLFIEEMLKQIYELAVTPFSSKSLFLGKEQASVCV